MVFYSMEPDENVVYKVIQTLSHVTSDYTESGIDSGENLSTVLTAADGYTIENVVVMMGGEDVTDTAWTSGTRTVAITGVSGEVQIIATAVAGL